MLKMMPSIQCGECGFQGLSGADGAECDRGEEGPCGTMDDDPPISLQERTLRAAPLSASAPGRRVVC